MKSRNIVLVILLMLSSHISAQKYFSGTIVTNDGDTLKCMIKARKWDVNPNKVVTRSNDKIKRYWPTEIASFQVDSRVFVSARTKLDVSNHLDGLLDVEDSQPRFVNDSIFAEIILEGKKNLYRYKSSSYKEHFLIGDQNGQLHALIFKRFYVWVAQNGTTVKHLLLNEAYKDQLEKHFADCPAFKEKIAVTGYDGGQLSSLFRLYFNCLN